MKRREFVRRGLAGGIAAVIPQRAPGAGGGDTTTPARLQAFELEEATVGQLAADMSAGRRSARRIVELYLERIAAIDRSGPTLRSVIELNPDAVDAADALDAERQGGRVRGPLHGIPVLIKDNIDTADRMQTTAGSLALEGSTAPRDAFIVERLRAAGAVLLGKTNLSEWANFRGKASSSGWSGRGGQTRNPYVLDRSPCGSSSGSGVAAAANLATLTIGTETNGSIVCPASANGIVGVKPTVGLWSRSGIIPISHTQDTAGPMCRTVTDAAILLGALVGVDPRDPATAASRGKTESSYPVRLAPDALRGARLGVARKGFGFGAKVEAAFDEALRALRTAGAVLVEPAELPSIEPLGADELELFRYELKAGLEAYLATRAAAVPHRTLQDLIAFNERHRERELSYFGQEYFLESAAKGPLTTPAYRALRRRLLATARANFTGLLTRRRLDAVVCITAGPAWCIDLVNGDQFTGGNPSYPAITGAPHVTVPGGQVQGLPVGLSFFGPAWSESRLLGYAYGFEQLTRARALPAFRPAVADPA
jgi:amidase